ncbi:hypothetical protein DFJ74DRAFT_644590 [Hyaloraphidium curvatum]|nr:hypothetical protein DFJ74DRAFT_644590 [Hyaloraphidium curvatum]
MDAGDSGHGTLVAARDRESRDNVLSSLTSSPKSEEELRYLVQIVASGGMLAPAEPALHVAASPIAACDSDDDGTAASGSPDRELAKPVDAPARETSPDTEGDEDDDDQPLAPRKSGPGETEPVPMIAAEQQAAPTSPPAEQPALRVQTGAVESRPVSPTRSLLSSSRSKSASPQELVHRSNWAFKRSSKNGNAFNFVVPGDFGVTSLPAGVDGEAKKAKKKKGFDAFGKGIGRMWAKTVGLAKFGKSVIASGDADADDARSPQPEVTPVSPVSPGSDTVSPTVAETEAVHEAAVTIQRFVRSHLSLKLLDTVPSHESLGLADTTASELPSEASAAAAMPATDIMASTSSITIGDDEAIARAVQIIQRAFRRHRFRSQIANASVSIHAEFLAVVLSREKARAASAARTVQRSWRSTHLRREVTSRAELRRRRYEERRTSAAKVVQRAFRAYRLRKAVQARIDIRTLPKRTRAALAIQRAYRRHKTRHSFAKFQLTRGDHLQRLDSKVVAAWRGHMLRAEIAFRVARRRQIRHESAAKVQTAWRAHTARTAARQERKRMIAQRIEEESIKVTVTLEHEQSILGSLPDLTGMGSPNRVPSTPSRPRHARRTSTDSTCSRSSVRSKMSTSTGGWDRKTHIDYQDPAPMEWEDKDEYKNPKDDKLPKLKFARGGGVFSDFVPLYVSEREARDQAQELRSSRRTSGNWQGYSRPRSVAETPVSQRSPMGSRKPLPLTVCRR